MVIQWDADEWIPFNREETEVDIDGWLEAPYIEEAEKAEGEEWADEHGYDSLDDYLEELLHEKAYRDRKMRAEDNFLDRQVDTPDDSV